MGIITSLLIKKPTYTSGFPEFNCTKIREKKHCKTKNWAARPLIFSLSRNPPFFPLAYAKFGLTQRKRKLRSVDSSPYPKRTYFLVRKIEFLQ